MGPFLNKVVEDQWLMKKLFVEHFEVINNALGMKFVMGPYSFPAYATLLGSFLHLQTSREEIQLVTCI